ncbi:hypothetical protein B0H14DRAFT_2367982, partial [Mycena olivaceomarginata]
VFVWDILNNIRSEYSLLFKHKSSATAVAYVMSRLGALVFVLGFAIFASYPFEDCNKALVAFNCFLPIAVCGSAFLFFHRGYAVYGGDRLVTIILGCLSLAAVGASIVIPTGESALAIGDPAVCIIGRAGSYIGSSAIILTVQDTATFLAIAYRIMSNLSHSEQQEGGKQGKAPVMSTIFLRAILMDGQMYYLIVVLANISAAMLLYIPSVPPPYRGLLILPHVTLTSVMACRVYRNKVLGWRRVPELSLPTLNDVNTIPLSVVQFQQQQTDMTGSLHMDSNESHLTRHGGADGSLHTKHKASDADHS